MIKIDYSKPIQFETGWNCCSRDRVTHVIVFDCGTRWAVCTCCSNQYRGPVFSLAIFNLPQGELIDCQCESSLCDHENLCTRKAVEGTNKIVWIGETCDKCYNNFEDVYKTDKD